MLDASTDVAGGATATASGGAASRTGDFGVVLIADVAQHYVGGKSWQAIADATDVPVSTVHAILHDLFNEGFPKLERRKFSDEDARTAYRVYLRRETTTRRVATAHGVHRTTVEQRWRTLGLVKKKAKKTKQPRNAAHAAQQAVTKRLVERIDELREPRRLTLENLAIASGLSEATVQHMRYDLSDPQLTTVLHLCVGLGVTPGQLLDPLPQPTSPRPRRPRRGVIPKKRGARRPGENPDLDRYGADLVEIRAERNGR
jgi:transcriptional regulator with XRE-family HTH domain